MTRLAVAALLCLGACGYEPVYGTHPDALRVKLVRSTVADAVVADEVVSGVREALARSGALAAGEGDPRVEIEVTREGERSEGIRVNDGGPGARATSPSVVGRAWIARGP